VIGHPVAHSRSPLMHMAALRSLGLAGIYRAIDISGAAGLGPMAEAVRRGTLEGVNITMPHKETAFLLADATTEEARLAGSVNTWFADHGVLWGDSTDVAGVNAAWEKRNLPDGAPVLVLGAGGAARAAVIALRGRQIVASARRAGSARLLADLPDVNGGVQPWGIPVAGAVVVNCTPLGMGAERLPEPVLDQAVGIFDMAYGEEQTPAVAHARSAGLPFVDGIDLLVAQAEVSFERWTGVRPPAGVMEAAARNASRALWRQPNQPPTPRQE
jgi:shikimate dehydrogenase